MEVIEKQISLNEIFVMGLDEVGRGPLAGSVVSCCFAFKGNKEDLLRLISHTSELGVTDSKKLSSAKRLKILSSLNIDVKNLEFNKVYKVKTQILDLPDLTNNLYFCLSEVDHREIDKINILQASLRSMDLSFFGLSKNFKNCEPDFVWVDGNKLPKGVGESGKAEAIVKGDSKSFIIALASIVAKEKRDFMMKELSQMYPGYGFEKHAGYPTKFHKEAIKRLGPCPIHRLSFKGVL